MGKKTDLHCHIENSCTREYLINLGIEVGDDKINDIKSMIDFGKKYIDPLRYDRDKLSILIRGSLQNCIETGVSVVAPSISFSICEKVFNNNAQDFINYLNQFKYKKLKILWDLGIGRDRYDGTHKQLITDLIKSGFFKGIDLYATENSKPNSLFIDFFKLANELGMTTKVHAGEQLGSDYILQCINDFNPKHIQHGITIVDDKSVMQIARERGILFNVCPTSNVVLGYAKSIANHPIREMYDFGLRITIATDDILFFQSDINSEYKKLLEAGVFTKHELNKIRKNAFKYVNL